MDSNDIIRNSKNKAIRDYETEINFMNLKINQIKKDTGKKILKTSIYFIISFIFLSFYVFTL